MTKRAVIYARVSTDEQAEHGYSRESQIDACRSYAVAHELTATAELREDYSGAKLDRPEMDKLREMIRRREVDAVIVFSPDRLTRNLAHSLILREEWRKAGIELHYCNRGKSEDTAESRMTENIEAVFGDYWREKIIEASARGRRTKAASGKWPCDGHAAYGYSRVGKARDARLEVNQAEAEVVRRIFTLYAGQDGMPLPMQTIAAILTAEVIAPPNRGGGMARPAKGWHRGTLRNILARRAYAYGEFYYGGHTINLPELAIIDPDLFEAAQRRMKASSARVVTERRHNFLLAGHIGCSCGLSMSGKPVRGYSKTYLYYACNSESNKRHMRDCSERMARADVADPLIWDWLAGLLCNPEKLEKGLRELAERQETELYPKQERLSLIVNLMAETNGKIKRLAGAFAEEQDEMIAAALRGEMKAAARERDALSAEYDALRADLTSSQMTEVERKAIIALAAEVRQQLEATTFAQKRALLNLLDIRVKLDWRDGVRGLSVSCSLTIEPPHETSQPPNPTQIPNALSNPNGNWLRIPGVVQKLSFTTTTRQTPYKIVVLSTWLPLTRQSPGDSTLAELLFASAGVPVGASA